ncbi:MAG: hypothetical protein FWD11_01420 [Micrococcales bacterium]|nr:hypothetical protein [Micrococcales bacterium]
MKRGSFTASGFQRPEHPQPGVATSRHRVVGQHRGLGRYAVVELSAQATQGESVVAAGYDQGRFSCPEWDAACFDGIAYVLARTPGQWAITVREVTGHAVDTTPATVGYAAIRAMCEVTGCMFDADELARLESFALGQPPRVDATANFETLCWEPRRG